MKDHKSVSTTVRLTPADSEAFNQASAAMGISKSELMIRATRFVLSDKLKDKDSFLAPAFTVEAILNRFAEKLNKDVDAAKITVANPVEFKQGQDIKLSDFPNLKFIENLSCGRYTDVCLYVDDNTGQKIEIAQTHEDDDFPDRNHNPANDRLYICKLL